MVLCAAAECPKGSSAKSVNCHEFTSGEKYATTLSADGRT